MNLKTYSMDKLSAILKRDLTEMEKSRFLYYIEATTITLDKILTTRIEEFITEEGSNEQK